MSAVFSIPNTDSWLMTALQQYREDGFYILYITGKTQGWSRALGPWIQGVDVRMQSGCITMSASISELLHETASTFSVYRESRECIGIQGVYRESRGCIRNPGGV